MYGTGIIAGIGTGYGRVRGWPRRTVRENECSVDIISSNLRTGCCEDDLYQQSPLQM